MSIAFVLRPFAVAVLMLAGATTAAFPQVDDEATDPPGRVGRLSYMDGTVSFRNADEEQWVPATLNFPVTTGDAFWTEPNSRSEIQIGSTDLRLDQMTLIQVAQLDDNATQIQLDQGSINLRVREMPPGGVRVITSRAAVTITQPGRYHVDVAAPQGDQPGNEVRVAVLEGAARIDGLAAPLTVTTGHSATLRDDQPYPLLAQAVALPLDTWALERERQLTPKQAQQYVSPEMTGASELDQYGQWVPEPTYGAVWYPQAVPADWAPYRYGYWAYVAPWGWTWVDQQPWGFAPFRYGRWVRIHDRWGWCPGARVHRPVYAPALVVFASGGHGAILVTSGRRPPTVGWVPLGPREVYRPYYRHSPHYMRAVNITNVHVTNITVINKDGHRDRDHHNFRDRDGLTVVSASAFTGAMAANKARVSMRDSDLSTARRADSLGDLKPSRSARAGVAVPAVAAATEPRQRSRRGDRDDSHLAPPASSARPAMTTARDPDVLPSAPGPKRLPSAHVDRTPVNRAPVDRSHGDRRQSSGGKPAVSQREREPAASPFHRTDRAAPALRAPGSATSAPPALRAPEPPSGRAPASVTPPSRNPNAATTRPSDPPGRLDNSRRSERNDREPANLHLDDTHRTPRAVSPAQPQPPTAPTPPAASTPRTMAPQQPTPLKPAAPTAPNRRDSSRPDTDRRHAQPQRDDSQAHPRPPQPSRDTSSGIQRPSRPQPTAQQHGAPSQMRRDDREARREPTRTMIMPQQSNRPSQQAPRQIAPQSAERRSSHSTPDRSPQATQGRSSQPSAESRRSDSSSGRGGGSRSSVPRPD
jgi:hypothetical protein